MSSTAWIGCPSSPTTTSPTRSPARAADFAVRRDSPAWKLGFEPIPLNRIGLYRDELRKAFLRGYEEGLKAAWREIGLLTTRGYSSTELSVMAKSKMAVLYRDVEAMASRLSEEEPATVGPSVPQRDIGGRGAYLVREPKADRIFELFSDLVRAGARGRFYNVVDLVNRLETETRSGRQGRRNFHRGILCR